LKAAAARSNVASSKLHSATEKRATGIVTALKGGFDPPLPQLEVARADNAELAAANANYRALEVVMRELTAEHNKAAEIAAAAKDVREKAAAVVDIGHGFQYRLDRNCA